MSDVIEGRLTLLATASIFALAAISWSAVASAQDAAEDPASGGESTLDAGSGDDSAGIVDDAGSGEAVDPAVTDVEAGAAEDPAVTNSDDDSVVDFGPVDVEVTDFEVSDVDGTPPEVDVMMQSGVPEVRRDAELSAPAAANEAHARESKSDEGRDDECRAALTGKDCVAN